MEVIILLHSQTDRVQFVVSTIIISVFDLNLSVQTLDFKSSKRFIGVRVTRDQRNMLVSFDRLTVDCIYLLSPAISCLN